MKDSPFVNGRSPNIKRIVKCHECGSINVAKSDSPKLDACIHIQGAWFNCNDCKAYCLWEDRDTVRRDSLDVGQEATLSLIQKSYQTYHNLS